MLSQGKQQFPTVVLLGCVLEFLTSMKYMTFSVILHQNIMHVIYQKVLYSESYTAGVMQLAYICLIIERLQMQVQILAEQS